MMQWIRPNTRIPCPRLYKAFALGHAQKAELRISGLGLYTSFLNGKRIGEDYLTPGFNDYDAYVRYQTYDVTEMLQEENCLEVLLGNGWYKGRIGLDGSDGNIWGDDYALAAELRITQDDGTVLTIETDTTWLATQSCIVDGNIYDGEYRDDTREPGTPVPCHTVTVPGRLEAQFSPCIRIRETRKPVLVITPKGEQVLDFGQNMAGIIRFVNRLPRGEKLFIQTGEVLQEGNFYRDNLRSAKSEYMYVSDGKAKEVEPLFTFFGFRYAKVECSEAIHPEDFTALVLTSDNRETLEVDTSHALLNRLMCNSLWGQRSNFLDVPTDCPQRDERLGWTADTQVFVNTACYQMDCHDFYRKYMRDMREDQVRYFAGDIPFFSPSLKGRTGHGSAVWADAATIIPWNVYMQYGDLTLLRENYPMMRDFVEYMIRQDVRLGNTHIVFDAFTFGDWLAQDGMTPQSVFGGTEDSFIQGVYYYNSVYLTALAAQTVDEKADAARFASLADQIHTALLNEYITPNGRLSIDTQTGYVLALYYGIYRDRSKLLEGFERRLRRDFYRITCGFTGAPLMLPVLFDNGMDEAAYRMLLTEEFPGWLYTVKLGATTIWERWNSLDENGKITGTGMNSLNHYAYGSVCEAVYSRIMGLRNMAPGWKKAWIAPRILGQLQHASISFASPAGMWKVAWELLENQEISMKIAIPEGAQAHVILPWDPEERSMDLESGAYSWQWKASRDLLHPFSVDAKAMDVLACQQAVQVLEAEDPVLLQSVKGKNNERSVMTIRQLMQGKDSDAVERINRALQKVHI